MGYDGIQWRGTFGPQVMEKGMGCMNDRVRKLYLALIINIIGVQRKSHCLGEQSQFEQSPGWTNQNEKKNNNEQEQSSENLM